MTLAAPSAFRRLSWRGSLAAAALASIGAGCALGACSSSSSQGTGGGTDASSNEETGHPTGDGAAPNDATTDQGTEAGPKADAGLDGTAPHDGGTAEDAGDCGIGASGEPTDLGCTGLYSDWATKTVASNVNEFAPGYTLWSDGAQKTRWIYLPPGQTIDTSNMDEWVFPVGTKLWKEFKLPVGDSATPIRLETRLLWKRGNNDWYRTTYRWSDDGQTSATELTTGELDANGDGYEIPSQVLCNVCHNGRIDGVLGFEAVGLASSQATGFDMQALMAAGLLSNPPTSALTVPGDPTAAAALEYLHANCGTACHNGGNGEAKSSGFLTRLDVATLSTVQATDTYATGWNVKAATYHIPDAGTTYRLHACDVASSAAYYRAAHRDGLNGTPPQTQMPPIDTHAIDDAGLAVLAAWINEGCDGGP